MKVINDMEQRIGNREQDMDNGREKKFKEALKKASIKIKELEAEVSSLKQQEAIVIIGMGCRFPGGAHTPEDFWNLLEQGRDMVSEIPKDRWDIDKYYDPDPETAGKMLTRQAAFLDEVDNFDAGFFEISPREAEYLDPQQRLLLELSWEALEHAGIDAKQLRGSRTGVFMGMCGGDYVKLGLYSGKQKTISGYAVSGVSYSGGCGRISYFFDFHGPSAVLDTACSSSLTAMDVAMQSLNKRESDLALVGGVSLLLSPDTFISFSRLRIISPDGRCRAFDQAANGFGRGEGGGVVVLKRFSDAARDGDNILAVVKASAVNQDGKSNGFLAPNGTAQQLVVAEALKKANLSPGDIDYVETHGTGTSLGDPVEIQALANVFEKRENKLLVGSVKTNIGHLDAAAGIAGIMKVVLALQHHKIPPSLHFKTPSAYIQWDRIPIRVAAALTPWEKGDNNKPRRAGVSSFGFTGINAHVIIEEAPQTRPGSDKGSPAYHILSFSAKKPGTLLALAGKYKEYLSQNLHDNPADICYTANISRSSFKHRFALVGRSTGDFIKKLTACLDNREQAARASSPDKEILNHKIVFMFTGQDSQYKGMGRELYQSHPLFKEEMEQCDALFRPHSGDSITRLLYGEETPAAEVDRAIHAQPVIFSIQYALSRLWRSWGILPSAVIGHSIGEYAAACCAGVFTLEQAVQLVAGRAKFMENLPGKGKMVGILADESTITALIAPQRKNVSIAAVNAPKNVTISGETAAVDAVIQKVKASGIFIEELNISHAFHSVLTAPYIEKFQKEIAGMAVSFSKPRIPMISTKTGQQVTEKEICSPGYWGTHLGETVRFYDAMKTLENRGYQIFVEIGGTAALSGLASQCIPGENAVFIPSLRKGRDPWQHLLTGAADLYLHGIDIDWKAFNQPYSLRKVALPTYPFRRERYWIPQEPEPETMDTSLFPGPVICTNSQNPVINIREKQVNRDTDPETLETEIKEMIHTISGVNISEIEADANLFSFGMDSLMLVRLRDKIDKKYGVSISLNEFFMKLETPGKITAFIRERMPRVRVQKEEKFGEPALDPGWTEYMANQGSSEVERIMALQMKTLSDSMSRLMTEQLETLKSIASPGPVHREKGKTRENLQPKTVNFRSMKNEADRLTPAQQEFVRQFIDRYTQRTRKSKQYIEKHREVFSDWINSLNFRITLKELIYPIVSSGSQGARFRDIDGNEYIDIAIGYGASFFGHRPAFVIEALKEQMDKGFQLGPQSDLAGEVARLIKELTGVERVTFCNTGSEAVMAALRLARTVTKRKTIVRFAGSYHGTSDGVLAEADENGTFPIAPGIMEGMVEDVTVLHYGVPESLDKIREMGDQLAAVLVEPVQSRKPGLQPGEFLEELRKITSETGTALIFDEMITGFRIHPGGAQAHFGVRADIVTYGKIVGGGMPMAVVAGKREFLDAIDGGSWNYGDLSYPQKQPTFFAGTYCKHPLSMAASRAVLRHMKELGPALQEGVNEQTRSFVNTLNQFFEEEHVPIRVKHFGSLFRFESFGKYDLSLSPIEMDLLFYLLMERGIFTWESRICCFSTAHTDEDMELIIKAVKDSIRELRAGGFPFEGSMHAVQRKETSDSFDDRCYPMSSLQEGMFILSQMEGGESAYHQTMATLVAGELDPWRLESVFKELIKRHDSFRTGFELENGRFVQKSYDSNEITFGITHKKITKDNIRKLIEEFIRPFNLSEPPLMRICVAEIPGNFYLLIFDSHHIIADGLSMNILSQEMMNLYQGKELKPVKMQYKDYVKWERHYLDSDEYKRHEKYWLQTLAGELPRVRLPLDFPRPPRQSFEGNTLHFRVEKNGTNALKQLARDTKTTLYMVFLAVFNILLYKLTGQEDIIVGAPVTVKDSEEFNHTIGMFTNSLVLRNRPAGNKPFLVFLEEIKHHCLHSYAARQYPLDRLVRDLDVKRDISHNPLFDVQFVYENGSDRVVKIKDLTFQPYYFEVKNSPLDFTFEVIAEEDHLNVNLNYCTKLFSKETIEKWYNYFEKITGEILTDTNVLLADIDWLSGSEKHQLLVEFNDTRVDYPKHKTIHELFEEQAESTPDHISLTEPSDRKNRTYMTYMTYISYRELNEKSNQLAYLLKEKGVKPGTIVGIMVEPSLEMIIGLVGILKAGGAYMPIDPGYPQERIDFMLKDSSAKVLITTSTLAKEDKKLRSLEVKENLEIVFVDSIEFPVFSPSHLLNFSTSHSTNLAYIIYTSGSTGKPKGVMIEHRNVVRLVKNSNYIDFTGGDKLLMTGSFVFDVTTFEIWGPLLNGLSLYLVDKDVILDAEKLKKITIGNKISLLHLIPQLFNQLAVRDHEIFAGLKYLLVGGDLVQPRDIGLIRKKYQDLKIIHLYGPTENTTFSTFFPVPKDYNIDMPLPIGKPLANSTVYIIDKYDQLQPVGVPGELCVGGDGVARGYLNKPGLTAEKFIELEVKVKPEERENRSHRSYRSYITHLSYKTGDLAMWLPDGNVKFLGRIDHQVKIRGFRIEPGEIENLLSSHQGIKEVVVLTKKDSEGNNYLSAYYVGKEEAGKSLSLSDLRQFLSKKLPGYMIPSYFIALEKLPLNPNGKIDRKALPEPGAAFRKGADYQAPTSEPEKKIAGIWQDILGIKGIGINDNFFEIGGHSLKAVKMLSQVKHELGVDIPLHQLFIHQTLSALSGYILSGKVMRYEPIPLLQQQEYYEVSHSQKRMWIMDQLEGGGLAQNMVGTFEIRGGLNREVLEKALQTIVQRHESLRTRFITVAGEVKQQVQARDVVDPTILYMDLRKKPDRETAANEMINKEELIPFDLKSPPLLRAKLLRMENKRYILLCTIHHIIADGWSIRVLTEELSLLYNAYLEKKSNPLEPLLVQYKEYARWQNQRLNSGQLKDSEAYWLQKFAGDTPELDLPLDYPPPEMMSYKGAALDFTIGPDLTAALREFSREYAVTLFMTLMAALEVLLSRVSYQTDIVIGVPTAGRTDKDTEKLIGHFLNILPVRIRFDQEYSFDQLLKTVKKEILAAYKHQDYPLDTLVEKLKLKRDYSRGALFDVLLILNNRGEVSNSQRVFNLRGASVKPRAALTQATISNLEFHFNEGDREIPSVIRYNSDLFEHETIEHLGRQWLELLEYLPGNRETPLKHLQLSDDGNAQQNQVVAERSKMERISMDF